MAQTADEKATRTTYFDKHTPFTGEEYLESLRDGREIWIYGERVKDVTTHPAFRNTVRMLARLYDALADPGRKDVLTTEPTPATADVTHPFYKGPRIGRGAGRRRATRSPSGRSSPTAGWAARPTTRPRSSRRSAPTPDYYEPYADNARRWYTHCQETVAFVNHAIVNPPVDRDRPLDDVKDVYMHVEKETDGGLIVSGAKVVATDLDAHALQLHRQQRRAPDQDRAVRLRLHRPERLARAEALLPARRTR